MSLPYKAEMISRARELRKKPTKQENHLWFDFLRTYPIRFQRQKVINSFVADFYCHQARLIVEIDGSQHYSPDGKLYDLERTSILSNYGLFVLRFPNFDVDHNFQTVCGEIHRIVQERIMERSQGSP